MKIREFIQDRFRQRLEERRALVVYDPEGRYRQLTLDINGGALTVVDAGSSIIQAREKAFAVWRELGHVPSRRLLVYVPAPVPNEDERFDDPFYGLALCGSIFPASDADDFQSLCRKAKEGNEEAVMG